MIVLQTLSVSYPSPPVAAENIPLNVSTFVEHWTRFDEYDKYSSKSNYTLIETGSKYEIESLDMEEECIVFPSRLNDIRYINKFLETINQKLQLGGRFIGCVETSKQRQRRLEEKWPYRANKFLFNFDYLIHRVVPKLPVSKSVYFGLTKGKNRAISKMETFGRLYSCGFKVLESKAIDGKLYFAAEKTGEPKFDPNPTYGPFITLNRIGKGDKMMKVYKIRTMYPFSEYVQQYIYEQNGLGDGAKFKDDPRINRVGKFMRGCWADELPMLFHLIKGEVKFFGVRPISEHYFSLFPEDFQEYRRKFKPGLIPPVYVEIPKCIDDTVDIERRYLEAYEKQPWLTDLRYMGKFIYNIVFRSVRSK
ncbi:MAG: hypothetical protein DHS20C18_09290 [Saprospiraceae bacterium]|nr:MAG: hypothetical protein DHS20C18_09290 [Saprospiraceae bacterium]